MLFLLPSFLMVGSCSRPAPVRILSNSEMTPMESCDPWDYQKNVRLYSIDTMAALLSNTGANLGLSVINTWVGKVGTELEIF